MERILVAINAASPVAAVLRTGLEIAKALNAQIRVLHVADPDIQAGSAMGAKSQVDDARRDAEQLLAKVLAEHDPDRRAQPRVGVGPIAGTILTVAQEWNAEMIVLGGTVRRGILGFFQDRIAEEVLKRAPCPVLVVPARPPASA